MTTKIKVVATTNLEAFKHGLERLTKLSNSIVEDSTCKTVDLIMKDMTSNQIAELAYHMEGVMKFADHVVEHCVKYFYDNDMTIEIVKPFTQPKSNKIH